MPITVKKYNKKASRKEKSERFSVKDNLRAYNAWVAYDAESDVDRTLRICGKDSSNFAEKQPATGKVIKRAKKPRRKQKNC